MNCLPDVWIEPCFPLHTCVSLGERRRKVICVRKSDHLEVSDQRCEHLPHPVALTEPCNTDCEVRWALTQKTLHSHSITSYRAWKAKYVSASLMHRWHVAGKSECSAKCGSGYHSLDVQCMKYNLVKRESERMEASACGRISKPHTRESCHGDCLLKNWQYSAWAQVGLVDDLHGKHIDLFTELKTSMFCLNTTLKRITK